MSLPLIAFGAVLERIAAPLIGLLIAGLLALSGWQYLRAERAENALEKERSQIAQQVAREVSKARADERRRTVIIQEAQDADVAARRKAETDARRAVAAGISLQHQLAAVRAAYVSSHTDAAAERASAGEAIAVLTDLLSRCSERRRDLARFADEAHGAGQLCERTYTSLIN